MKKFKNYGFIILVMLFSKFLMGFGEVTIAGDENSKTMYNLGDLGVRAWSLRARVMNSGTVGDSIVVHHGEWLRAVSKNDLFSGYATSAQLTDYMTTSAANSLFTAMQATVDAKVPTSRTLTIGGATFDLSANRTWSLTTSNVSEGTNLYYTDARFDTRFNTKTTTNLTEGSNLYYTQSRFDTAFGNKSTTNLTEGSNLYYTLARFNTAFAGKTTTDLIEGTNLYFNNTRSRASISLTTTGTGAAIYNSTTGVFNIPTPVITPYTAGFGIDITSFVVTNTAPDPGRIINAATVGLSKAQLNTSYPNVPVGYMVMCPSIILGGAVYIKATEAGTSDVWQTVSAPPTL